MYVFYLEFVFAKLGYIKFSGIRAGVMPTWMSGKLTYASLCIVSIEERNDALRFISGYFVGEGFGVFFVNRVGARYQIACSPKHK